MQIGFVLMFSGC